MKITPLCINSGNIISCDFPGNWVNVSLQIKSGIREQHADLLYILPYCRQIWSCQGNYMLIKKNQLYHSDGSPIGTNNNKIFPWKKKFKGFNLMQSVAVILRSTLVNIKRLRDRQSSSLLQKNSILNNSCEQRDGVMIKVCILRPGFYFKLKQQMLSF